MSGGEEVPVEEKDDCIIARVAPGKSFSLSLDTFPPWTLFLMTFHIFLLFKIAFCCFPQLTM